MKIEELNLQTRQLNILHGKGIDTVEEFMTTLPNKYLFFDKTYPLELTDELQQKITTRTPVAMRGICRIVDNEYKVQKKMSLVKIRVEDIETKRLLYINIIGGYKMLPLYQTFVDQEVIVGGVIQYNHQYHSFSMMNPTVISRDIAKYNRIVPVYRKYKGLSEENYEKIVKEGYDLLKGEEFIPEHILQKYKLDHYHTALNSTHFPVSEESIRNAKKRFVFEDMLYFTSMLEEMRKETSNSSPYRIHGTDLARDSVFVILKGMLSYTLTESQQEAISEMFQKASAGERIKALIQGDVGSGKTIVAIAIMLLLAESGYQTAFMAPTAVLAKQHYSEISEYAEKLGFKAVFLASGLKAAERRDVLQKISSGEADIVVGTHSLISNEVTFHNLALTVTDEEHKFGVVQRESLQEKAKEGVHSLTMSATPIPRTLANTLYGDSMDVYSLQRPAERKPVKTILCSSDKAIFDFLKKEIDQGHQCYVVCPLIDKGKEDSKMQGVSSVEDTVIRYHKYFDPLGVKIGVLTGKNKSEEQAVIIRDFKDQKTQILIATTVIEVGVNVPNATAIVISGAERFGLATLHQLRGRVGRSNLQSYCILQKSASVEMPANNMQILCGENDGYKIAEADLKNRGTGDLLGAQQSGKNNFITLMLEYPNMYKKVKEIAKELCKTNEGIHYIHEYEARYEV